MLPAFRGPHPLFWQLRDGLTEIGVTMHRMDAGLDTGDIALQEAVALPDGLSGPEIEWLAGDAGGRLFVKALQSLATGNLSLQPQQPGGSRQGRPQEADFVLDRAWSARRAFNFLRGTTEWGRPYPVEVNERLWPLHRALAYYPEMSQDVPVKQEGNRVKIQFNPGVLEAV
jgi:methionyl-tRNA formyltransferase